MAEDNLKKLNTMPLYLGTKQRGQATILQGDARNLEGLLVDKCIFSPPYTSDLKKDRTWMERHYEGKGYNPKGHTVDQFCPPDNPSNIGNLKYGSIDSVITSPPYEGSLDRWGGISEKEVVKRLPQPYTNKVDHIITSPPYENQIHKGSGEWSQSPNGKMVGVPQGEDYTKSNNNIGNLKSTSYLDAMLLVYKSCYAVLKPQGLLILITKDFIREKKRIDLAGDTIKLCEQSGFSFQERHYRRLMSQSFWRVIYAKKYPSAPEINQEDILVFKKEMI